MWQEGLGNRVLVGMLGVLVMVGGSVLQNCSASSSQRRLDTESLLHRRVKRYICKHRG